MIILTVHLTTVRNSEKFQFRLPFTSVIGFVKYLVSRRCQLLFRSLKIKLLNNLNSLKSREEISASGRSEAYCICVGNWRDKIDNSQEINDT